ncbi:hypothetical protein N431DRAFT_445060 [Stipitochalara longipes BDJ]|nr:hypothetical protein N431DRAFT_445060 [Stipitochalara longipes BDJ]
MPQTHNYCPRWSVEDNQRPEVASRSSIFQNSGSSLGSKASSRVNITMAEAVGLSFGRNGTDMSAPSSIVAMKPEETEPVATPAPGEKGTSATKELRIGEDAILGGLRFFRLDSLRQHTQTVHQSEEISQKSLVTTRMRFKRRVSTERTSDSGIRDTSGSGHGLESQSVSWSYLPELISINEKKVPKRVKLSFAFGSGSGEEENSTASIAEKKGVKKKKILR